MKHLYIKIFIALLVIVSCSKDSDEDYGQNSSQSNVQTTTNSSSGSTTGTTTGTSGGVTATLRVRAESVECTGVFSDWYEVELFVVDENNPVSPLPTLREPSNISDFIDVHPNINP